eukprot:GFUD01009445.1.p1 GENE.GFUD01009445.1~~GFUD01009445.1.p1  ORF type:complete len:463 (+),score=149.43 GFUD01009445.1:53-1390(+)
MFRTSPSYSPPGGRGRSPSYSPPRARRFSPVRGGSTRAGVSPPRGRPVLPYRSPSGRNGRSRSRSPRRSRSASRRSGSRSKRSRSRSRGNMYRDRKSRSRSPMSKPGPSSYYPWQDEETLRTLNCKDCDVYLHDRDSMLSHLKGRPHLMQQQRLRDNEVRMATGGRGLNDMLRPDKDSLQYDDSYWDRERGTRKLRPEQERFLDTSRLDTVKAKFDSEEYDYGQFKYREKELYCDICDVWTRSRDQMQAHKEGANHKKKSAKVQRFQCKLCLIEVPCQDTLDNHMRGKDHIKREMQLQEQRKERGDGDESVGGGYKTGPREMAKLNNSEMEELSKLRHMVKILQNKVKQYQTEKEKCVREHGTQEVRELREKVKWCQEVHIRPKEFERKGIFCKREEGEDDQPSTSHRVKQEREEPRGMKREGMKSESVGAEYVEREVGGEIVLE